MRKVMLLGCLLCFCCSCHWWKKKALHSREMEQYIQRSLLDSTALRQISKDSLSWEQEQWRNLWVFADSLHPPMLVQEHVKSHAFQQGSQLTQQQSYQVRHDRLDRKEKELSYPPTKSWKWVQWLGILLLGLFLYFCWRRLKSI